MDFLVIDGFSVPPGKAREFQQWVNANAGALSKAAPDGIELQGVYATMFGSEKGSGVAKTIWRMDSYGAMDRFAAAIKQGGEFARLMEEFESFSDVRLGAPWSSELLKSITDISIWADNPEE